MQFNSVRSVELANNGSISGRVWLLGFSLVPIYTGGGGSAALEVKVGGTIKISTSSTSADPLVEFPVTMTDAYPAGLGFSYIEHQGYVLFPNGLYVTQTTASSKESPLDTSYTKFSVYYQV
jgi:hypothetical protein